MSEKYYLSETKLNFFSMYLTKQCLAWFIRDLLII